MASYRIVLVNEKTRIYGIFAVLIFVLNMLFLGYQRFLGSTSAFKTFAIIVGTLIAILFGSIAIRTQRIPRFFPFAMLIFAVTWVVLFSLWWLSLLLMALGFLYMLAARTPTVELTDDFVRYPSFPVKRLQWNEVANLVLKDGLLTIDTLNNRLIQQIIDPAREAPNEQEINEFCRSRIIAAMKPVS